jgi:multidrug transporter EmrE-like cation transporter
MRALDLLLSVACAVLTTLGMILLKSALPGDMSLAALLGQAVPLIVAALVYFIGLGLWAVALARNELSTAYPIGIGLSLFSATLGGHWAFGEAVSLGKVAGGGFILLGAFLISRSRPLPPTYSDPPSYS